MIDIANFKNQYERDGYILIEGLLPDAFIEEVQSHICATIEAVSNGTLNDPLLDIVEDSMRGRHLRRIEHPETFHTIYDRVLRYEPLLDIVQEFLGGTVRFDHGKLNFKPPTDGTEVQWHQDWAFLPHTNDDMLAVGVMLDDVNMDNGPLMVVPGSHKGKVYSHHHNGAFVGGINIRDITEALNEAVPVTGRAGSISIHHTRMLHGSAANLGTTHRPMLFYNYFAVDAFPVFHRFDWEEFNGRILRGEPVFTPRIKDLPMRIPEPAPHADDGQSTRSLFELQQNMKGALY